MSELSDIQKLIRLKRYEQPPEDYFDGFLIDFQRRQRAEMLQRPLWQIAWERANLWLESFRVPTLAYASIFLAAVSVTGVIMSNQGSTAANTTASISLEKMPATSIGSIAPFEGAVAPASTAALPPSYILDKRPVSYDAEFSF